MDEGGAEIEQDVDDEVGGGEVQRGMADEGRRVKKLQNPKMPPQDEIDDHEIAGHFPFKAWYAHCGRGYGQEDAHH